MYIAYSECERHKGKTTFSPLKQKPLPVFMGKVFVSGGDDGGRTRDLQIDNLTF